jgi:hypothetical protein
MALWKFKIKFLSAIFNIEKYCIDFNTDFSYNDSTFSNYIFDKVFGFDDSCGLKFGVSYFRNNKYGKNFSIQINGLYRIIAKI